MMDPFMNNRSRAVCFLSLLTAAYLLSGCVFMDRLKQSLSTPPAKDKQITSEGQGRESALLSDILHFAGQVHHMPEQKRNKMAMELSQKLETASTPRDSLQLALLALYLNEDTLPTSEALSALDRMEKTELGNNLELLGLADLLREALLQIEQERKHGKTLADELQQQKKEMAEKLHEKGIDTLEAELAAEKKKNKEMAQKLQKLLEIEKIVEKRK
jgi:hypothetical protein